MPFLRGAALLLLLGAGQDIVLQVKINHRDGHVLIGIPSVTEFKVESSLGVVPIALKDLAHLKFDGEEVVATGRDNSSLKGKLKLEEFSITGILGDLKLKRGVMISLEVVAQPPFPAAKPQAGPLSIRLRSLDQNELVGTVEWNSVSCESTIGKFEIAAHQVIRFHRQAEKVQKLLLKDGTSIVGIVLLPELQVRSGLGVFTVKPDNIAEIHVKGAAPVPPAGKREEPPPAPAPAPAAPLGAKPSAKTPVKSTLGNLLVTRDGTKMYAVNLSEGTLCRWRLPGLEEDGSVPLSGVEKSVAIDPSGARIYATGQKTISILTPEPLKLLKSFQVERNIEDAVAVDKDTLLATGDGTVLISIPKTAVIEQYPVPGQRIIMPREQDRAYVGDWIFNFRRESNGTCRVEPMSAAGFSGNSPHLTQISPDGRYGCPIRGDNRVLRLGRCWTASQVEAARVELYSAAAFSPDSSKLYLLTADGFLKVYGVPDFSLLASHQLGVRATQAFVHTDGKSIILTGAATMESTGRRQPRGMATELVDLYRFEIPQ